MRSFFPRAVLFLLLSHGLIILLLYAYPSVQDYLPISVTAWLSAMSTLLTARAPALLNRSFGFNLSTSLHRVVTTTAPISTHVSPTMPRQFSSSSTARSSSSAIPHLSVHIAASSSGKGRKFRADANSLDFDPTDKHGLGVQKGKNLEEKRRSRPDSGQDAYFAAPVGTHSNPNSSVTAFAIADGVGGWTGHGIDPADFSHGLVSHMASAAQSWNLSSRFGPRELLQRGYDATITDSDIRGGGTTACVAVVDGHGNMRTANLGDSGYLMLRLGTVHHYSNPQTHAFNTPYQLSLTPPEILRQASMFGGMPLNDAPDKADVEDHALQHGDVLVLATDGVWDNLDAQDVLKIVSQIMREAGAWRLDDEKGILVDPGLRKLIAKGAVRREQISGTLQAVLAASIAGEAKAASMDQRRDGPFAKAAMKAVPEERWRGGKVDDIAVIVAVAVEKERGEERLKAKL